MSIAHPTQFVNGAWAAEPVKLRIRDLLLSALTVSSGAIDAISFLALGKVFSAFMTGNIAFLGLRVAGASAPGAVAIFTSMLSFAVGVYVSTRIVNRSTDGLWPGRVTGALGVSLIAHAAFVAIWFASGGHPSGNIAHVLLGLWALAMGIQSAAVRTLHVEGIFTTAATATVILFVSDISHWSTTIAERRRFASILISLFIGATLGSLLLVRAPIYAPILPFAMTAAVVATAMIIFNRSEDAAGGRVGSRPEVG
jgi:uncharacterized membrane protein YoaK (UPF0700 family)